MTPERMARALTHLAKAREALGTALDDEPHISLGTARGHLACVEVMLEASLETATDRAAAE